MTKAAFYLHNPSHEQVDYSTPETGNPGIGGTEYMIWLMSYLLTVQYPDMDILVLANHIVRFPTQVTCQQADHLRDALTKAHAAGYSVFVCPWGDFITESFLSAADALEMRIILWVHNFISASDAAFLMKHPCIKRVVCVGQEQYERLCDHRIFSKSTYINNTILYEPYLQADGARPPIPFSVCYMGSLTNAKGFDYLAEIWPEIEQRVPQAQLYVLGSGQLYDKTAQLGSYGIAEASYEARFMPYLTDTSGNTKSNVHFLGVVGGTDKMEIMNQMTVGVVNPTGHGETFCISAIEFEALGVPVVTIRKEALMDTVNDGQTGLLFQSQQEFVNHIVTLLSDTECRNRMSQTAKTWVREAFPPEESAAQWHKLIGEVEADIPAVPNYRLHHLGNGRKWLRQINHRIQIVLPFLPSVAWYEEHVAPALYPIKAYLKRLLHRY